MLDAKTFLVDTNVWIDYFMASEPHGKEVLAFFEAVDQRGGTLLYAPTTLKDVFFLVPRILRREAQAAGELVCSGSMGVRTQHDRDCRRRTADATRVRPRVDAAHSAPRS